MKLDRPTQVRLRWMGAGVAVVALVSVLWWWTGAGGGLLLLVLAVAARAFVRLSRDEQRQQGQEDLLARRFRNVLALKCSCPMPPYYDGWNLIEERNSAGAVVATYVHGANVDEMLLMTRGGTNYFYHADALGSVTHLSDATGALVEKYTYDVFGQPTILTADSQPLTASAFGNRFLFTGREYLAALGLYDYRNRIYMPMIGRFLQTDPIRFDAGDVNLYRYVGNNATSAVDPLGEALIWNGSTDKRSLEGKKVTPYTGSRPGIAGDVASTTMEWDINVKCKCENPQNSTLAKLETIKVDYRVVVWIRPNLGAVARAWGEAKEQDHVNDFRGKGEGRLMKAAQAYHDQQMQNRFQSVAACEAQVRAGLQSRLASHGYSIYESSIYNYDDQGKHTYRGPLYD